MPNKNFTISFIAVWITKGISDEYIYLLFVFKSCFKIVKIINFKKQNIIFTFLIIFFPVFATEYK